MPSFFSEPEPSSAQSQNAKDLLYTLRINVKRFAYERKQHEIVITTRYKHRPEIDEKRSKLLSELSDIFDKLEQIIVTTCEIKPIYSKTIDDCTQMYVEEKLTIQQDNIDRKSHALLIQIEKSEKFNHVAYQALGALSGQPSIYPT